MDIQSAKHKRKVMNKEKYFAFISYSRRDIDVANMIYRRMESFRYPSKIERQYRPRYSKYVKDIFFDRARLEFSQRSFHEEICQALLQSRYLIVICSKHSAVPNENGKHYVNDEISYFLSQHAGDYGLIVPVLLDGVRSLPPSINVEPIRARNNPICIRENGETGIDSAVAEILTYLFHLGDSSYLFRRLNSQRLRRFRIMAATGCVLAMTFLVMSLAMLILKQRADMSRIAAYENAREAELQSQKANDSAREAELQAKLAIQNAEIAERERSLASQSLEFMVDTFRMSDPLNSGQCDVRIIDALKARIPDIAKLEPWELRADVGCRDNVGMFHEATNLLFAAAALNESSRPRSPETAYALYCISWCYFKDLYDTSTALACANRALEIYEENPQQNRLKIATVCNAIGVFCIDSGENMQLAKQSLNRAYEIRQAELGNLHVDVATVCSNLGYMHAKEGQHELAEVAFKRALEIYVHNGATSHIGVARVWRGLGLIYLETKKYREAAASFEKAIEIQSKAAGRDSRNVMNLYRELGLTYRRLGEHQKALIALEDGLNMARNVAKSDQSVHMRKVVKDFEGHVNSARIAMMRELKVSGK